MQLNIKNPIVFFDLETTGINFSHDRIVEISYLKVSPNGDEEMKTRRINPEMWRQCDKVLQHNKDERHLRGGEATRGKYIKLKTGATP